MLPSLLTWANAPASHPSPFPPADGIPWAAGELPADELAALAASRGYTRTTETSDRVELDGAPVLRAMFHELPSALLDELADIVDASPETLADRERLAAPYDGAYTPEALHAHHDGPARIVATLRATARDLRRKPRAAKIIADRIAARLPVPSHAPDPDGEAIASAWLAQYDTEATIRRAELVRAYTAARTPGGLTPGALRALAVRRWGAPVTRDGYETHKPASAATSAPSLDAFAILLRVPLDALAALVAEHNPGTA